SAPFGCLAAPEDRAGPNRSTVEQDQRSARQRGEAQAQTRGPAPSSTTPTDGRLDPAPDPADVSGEEDVNIPQARKTGSLGVVKLDAESFDGLAANRAERLAAAGYSVPAPPAWVDEVTESELARRSLSGRSPIIASSVARDQKLACSDASTRGLVHRRLLWQRRLDRQ